MARMDPNNKSPIDVGSLIINYTMHDNAQQARPSVTHRCPVPQPHACLQKMFSCRPHRNPVCFFCEHTWNPSSNCSSLPMPGATHFLRFDDVEHILQPSYFTIIVVWLCGVVNMIVCFWTVFAATCLNPQGNHPSDNIST